MNAMQMVLDDNQPSVFTEWNLNSMSILTFLPSYTISMCVCELLLVI